MKKWNRMKALGGAMVIFCMTAANSLTAFCQANVDLDLIGGWRRDDLTSTINAANHIGTNDKVSATGLNIWEVGVAGRISPNFNDCGCDWLNNFFLKGFGNWGWIQSGHYKHSFNGFNVNNECVDVAGTQGPPTCQFNPDPTGVTVTPNTDPSANVTQKGHIKHGNAWDYSIGLGYIYQVNDCFSYGPVIGYSFDKLRYKATNVHTFEGNTEESTSTSSSGTSVDDGVRFTSKWTGPWIGAELYYSWCDFRFDFSYEYHWSRWRGNFNLANADLTDCENFSDRRKVNDAWGSVVNLHGDYLFCRGFLFGLGIRYEYYTGKDGVSTPTAGSFPAVGCRFDEYDIVKNTKWHSFAVTADLGYEF